MTKTQQRRLWLVVIIFCTVAGIMGLVLYALRQNINLFYTPTELQQLTTKPKAHIRVGGMVRKGSVKHTNDLTISFVITDHKSDLEVTYTGVLPDLFREGQGVVALGILGSPKVFKADQILAKHDENYMPAELVGKTFKESDVT